VRVLTKEIITLVLVLLSMSGCKVKHPDERKVISIKGSDTMVNLVQTWAEEYMKLNPDVSIQVTGGGSGIGIAALINNTTDIAASSRELKEKEKALANENNITYSEINVALDGLAVIVHPTNKISNLTMDELRDIFTGKIKNFSELGGGNLPIVLYGRENSSGTYEFFKEKVLGRNQSGGQNEFAPSTQVLQGTASLAEAVSKDKKAIAYGGVGYFALRNDVKIIGLKNDRFSLPTFPVKDGRVNYELIRDKSYPISRSLYFYLTDNSKTETAAFMEFIKSPKGQKLVEKMEYIPLITDATENGSVD
jgi:phosphate transport system substrate-binding protein